MVKLDPFVSLIATGSGYNYFRREAASSKQQVYLERGFYPAEDWSDNEYSNEGGLTPRFHTLKKQNVCQFSI